MCYTLPQTNLCVMCMSSLLRFFGESTEAPQNMCEYVRVLHVIALFALTHLVFFVRLYCGHIARSLFTYIEHFELNQDWVYYGAMMRVVEY